MVAFGAFGVLWTGRFRAYGGRTRRLAGLVWGIGGACGLYVETPVLRAERGLVHHTV